ncbi:MAG: hypothetical protein ACFFH0_11005, partial [Promethearchaeota archaeon]
MAIGDEYESTLVTYPTHAELDFILRDYFEVIDERLVYGLPTFVVRWKTGGTPPAEEQNLVFENINKKSETLRV